MSKQIHQFFTNDHRRIEKLLEDAIENPDKIDMEYYNPFRSGLLTHIKMEEKILFPAAQKANGGAPLPKFAQLRLEHGAITSLMVPPPFADLIKVLKHVLDKHDLVEEEPGGVYEVCESLTKHQVDELLERLKETSVVPTIAFNPAPYALDSAKRSLLRAGYDFDDIVKQKL